MDVRILLQRFGTAMIFLRRAQITNVGHNRNAGVGRFHIGNAG
jgi:hypothetical protein